MPVKFPCSVCTKNVSDKCNSIQCDICDQWVHQRKCSGLTKKQFEVLSLSGTWFCPNCINISLPFPVELNTNFSGNVPGDKSDKLLSLISDLNKVVTSLSDDIEDELEFQFQAHSCSYVDCDEFKSIASNTPSKLSAFHLNIASLSKHFDDLQDLLALLNSHFSVIGISETKSLVDTETDSPLEKKEDFAIPDYKKFFTPTESSKGGVALYISNSFSCKPRKDLDQLCYLSRNLESCFAEIILPNSTNIIVGTIYRHPEMTGFNQDYLKPLLSKTSSEKKQLLLLGDFNLNLLKCEDDSEIMTFMDILDSNLILPQILLPTRITDDSKTLIDNILSSPSDNGTVSGNICYSISDHLPQFCLFPSFEGNFPGEETIYFQQDWSRFNREEFILDFLEVDWSTLFARFGYNPDSCLNVFNDKMKVLVDRHVPTIKLTKRQVRSKTKPWITPGILKSIKKRDHYQTKHAKAKTQESKDRLYELYRRYRNMIVALTRRSKKNHYVRYFDFHSKNSRKVWSGIRDIISTRANSESPISIITGDSLTSDPEKVANSFNDFFTTIADSIREKMPPSYNHFSSFLKDPNLHSLLLVPTTDQEISKVIGSFSVNKASGPHSIPTKILKLLRHDISVPISALINYSFLGGIFPSVLKISKVVPVFKNKGSPLEVSNYRPISLLSNIEKIYEKVMYSRLFDFLEQHNQIYSRQFGFRKAHSTEHTLINIVERIRNHLDNGGFACGVFVDLQKAFDTVDHKILLEKLDHYGVRGIVNDWFQSYLTNRSQFVFLSGSKSLLKPINHGVPQGSVLGPLLFLLYINDLHRCIRTSETYHFADDTHLLNFSKTVWSLCGRVNADLRVLVSWLNANKISLNASKTEFVIFRSPWRRMDCIPRIKLSGKILTPSRSVKYLGVHLDEHLNWKVHTSFVAINLRRANGAISKLRHYVPIHILTNIYHAIFASHVRYACQLWGLCDNTVTHRILTLQNTALRLMTFSEPRTSATPLFAELELLKFFDQVKVLNILFIQKYLKNNLPSDVLSTFNFDEIDHKTVTRGNDTKLLKLSTVKTTNFGLNSLSRLSSKQWNELLLNYPDTDIHNLDTDDLKSLATKYFLDKYKPEDK